ncbi:MAG: CBS domain-containing protein [Planctomycetota bacterium]
MSTVEQILLAKGSDVITALPDTSVRDAVARMAEANVGCVIVERDGRAVGIFTERDLLKRVVAAGRDPDTITLEDVMSAPVTRCQPDDNVRTCAEMMTAAEIRHLAVVEGDEPIGLVSMRDLLAAQLAEELVKT